MSPIGTALAAALAYRCVGSYYFSGLDGPDEPGGYLLIRGGTYATLGPTPYGYGLYGSNVTGSTWIKVYGATTASAPNAGTFHSWGLVNSTPLSPAMYLAYSTTLGVNHAGSISAMVEIELGSVYGMGSSFQLLAKEFTMGYTARNGKNFLEFNKATMHDAPPSIAQWVTNISRSVSVHGGVATLVFGGQYTDQDPINLTTIELWGSVGFKGAYYASHIITLQKGIHEISGGKGWPTIKSGDTWTGTVFIVFNQQRTPTVGGSNVVEENEEF